MLGANWVRIGPRYITRCHEVSHVITELLGANRVRMVLSTEAPDHGKVSHVLFEPQNSIGCKLAP